MVDNHEESREVDPSAQHRKEVKELTSRIRQLELENKAARTLGKGVYGLGALVVAGPGLVKAFRAWHQARRDGKRAPLEEQTQLSAAIVRRIFNIGLIGMMVTLLPIGLLFQQNRLLSKQNDAFARDTNIARRAQLIATIYETDCLLLEHVFTHEIDNPADEPKESKDVGGDDHDVVRLPALQPVEKLKDCPPRSDSRSRAEAIKALYSLDHPESTWLQTIWWKDAEKSRRVETQLSNVNLQGMSLARVNLKDAFLEGADLRGVNFYGANLYGANLSKANLAGSNLAHADLSNAAFLIADLTGAGFNEADLGNAILDLANLSHADFSEANLAGADIELANLYGANLYGANLSNAQLSDTDLSNAYLKSANLSNAQISGADLYSARSLRQEQVDTALGSSGTRLPSNLKFPCSWESIKCKSGAKYGEPIFDERTRRLRGRDPGVRPTDLDASRHPRSRE